MLILLNIAVLVVICGVTGVKSAKIVLVPYPVPSHVSQICHIGKELLKRGHDIWLILPSSYPMLDGHRGGPFHLFTHHKVEEDMYSEDLREGLKEMIGLKQTETMRHAYPGAEGSCRNFLSDQKLYENLKSLDPDLFIVDGLGFTHCYFVLPYRLGTPYVTFVTTYATFWYRNPSLPSFLPLVLGNPYTTNMTFLERLDNLYSYVNLAWTSVPFYNGKDWARKYAPERPSLSLGDLLRKSSLWLVDTDVTIDYPRPIMPNEIFVGGVTTQPAQNLSAEFEEIVASAEHGVIVMSLGSLLPDVNSERFMKVFSRLKQVVLWRHLSEYKANTPIPPNVHLVKWLPQADLLGHEKTKLSISHCGANGQFEALYHSVPMLCLPGFGDQDYNARRMEYHGFGQVLNLLKFTQEELYAAIIHVLETPSYRENIQHASQIYRSMPTHPLERASFWIEHVIKYGSDHLMSYALDMPWYSYIMLDIFAFILFLCMAFLALPCFMCCFIWRKNLGDKSKQKSD